MQQKRNSNIYRVSWIVPLAVFLGGIGGGIVFPILPILGVQFGLAPFFIGLILAGNRISRLASNQLVGEIIDRIGGKKPLIIGLIVESLGSILYTYALYSPLHGTMLMAGRLIWGVGSAFLFISANTIALNASIYSTRGRSTAMVRIALSLGVPAGLVMGGVLSGLFGDATAFLSSAAASLLAAMIVWLFFHDIEVRIKNRTSLLEALRYTLGHRSLFLISAFNFLVFFSLQGVVLTTLVLFVEYKHFSFIYSDPRFSAGVLMSFMMISSGITGFMIGKIIDKIKLRSTVSLPSALIVILGFVMLAFCNSTSVLIGSLILLGMGIGINNVALLSILGDLTPVGIRGRSVSVYQFMGDVGGTLGPIFGVQVGIDMGFRTAYIMTALLFSLSIPIVISIKKHEAQHKNKVLCNSEHT